MRDDNKGDIGELGATILTSSGKSGVRHRSLTESLEE